MPAYNSFNLATQGRSGSPNITTNYYNGIARPNPVGDQLGNQTAVQPRSTTNLTNTSTTGNYNNYQRGAGGTYGTDHPLVAQFIQQYGNRDFLDENGNVMEIPDSGNSTSSGRYIVNDSNPTLYGRNPEEFMQDPSRIMQVQGADGRTYYVYESGNIRPGEVAGYQRGAETSRRQEYQRNALIAASLAAAGYGFAGGFEGMFGPEALGGSGGVSSYAGSDLFAASGVPGGTAASSPSLWETFRNGITNPLSSGPVQLSGPGSTMTGTLIDGTSSAASSLATNPFVRGAGNVIGSIIGAVGERRNQQAYDQTIRDMVERGDTWGPDGREFAKRKLFELYNDPSSIENTPGYKFAQSQGEQGINRGAANKGYFRSPNMLFDLSKFNQELATKTWNDEFNKYAQMAGLSFNPAASSQIGASGANQSANMRGNTLDAILAAGGTFMDWLGGLG